MKLNVKFYVMREDSRKRVEQVHSIDSCDSREDALLKLNAYADNLPDEIEPQDYTYSIKEEITLDGYRYDYR